MGRIVRAARCWTKVSLEVIGWLSKIIQKKFEFAGNVRRIVMDSSAARVGFLASGQIRLSELSGLGNGAMAQ